MDKSERPVLRRKVNGLEIYFSYTAETIYIRSKNGWILYHRWFAGRGSFRRIYYPFAKALKNNRHIDFAEIARLANKYGMIPGGVYRTPTFEGHMIVDIPTKGRRRPKKGEPRCQRKPDPFGRRKHKKQSS